MYLQEIYLIADEHLIPDEAFVLVVDPQPFPSVNQGLSVCNIKYNNRTHGLSQVTGYERLESLLSCSVPQMQSVGG